MPIVADDNKAWLDEMRAKPRREWTEDERRRMGEWLVEFVRLARATFRPQLAELMARVEEGLDCLSAHSGGVFSDDFVREYIPAANPAQLPAPPAGRKTAVIYDAMETYKAELKGLGPTDGARLLRDKIGCNENTARSILTKSRAG